MGGAATAGGLFLGASIPELRTGLKLTGRRIAENWGTLKVYASGPDYSDMNNWYTQNNSYATAWSSNWNNYCVPSFNNVNSGGGWASTPDDYTALGNTAEAIQNLFAGQGSPLLDDCCMMCVTKNVPSPGTASSVLIVNPDSSWVDTEYNNAAGYGYNCSQSQVGSWITNHLGQF